MAEYKAPLRDIRFVRDELLGYPEHYANLPGCEDEIGRASCRERV